MRVSATPQPLRTPLRVSASLSPLLTATEGPRGDASAPAHATEGLCDASALLTPLGSLRRLSPCSTPLRGFSGKLVLVLASEPCDEGYEEEEPPDPVSGDFKGHEGFSRRKHRRILSLGTSRNSLSSFWLLKPRGEGSPGSASASEGSPGSASASEGSPGSASASESSPGSASAGKGLGQALLRPRRVRQALLRPWRVRQAFTVARLISVPARDDLLVARLNSVPARDDLLVARLNSVPARDDLLVAPLNSVPARGRPPGGPA
ncbi:hypothetical protein CRENBAI_002675 [Crenichthys baileyi]|uniref:Uncharacterized protein n=1 Tax=Crenichthys baileyi TaxID=28760 RepID=A0AAV9SFP2_9TELE